MMIFYGFVYVIIAAMIFRLIMHIRKIGVDKCMEDPLQTFGGLLWPVTIAFLIGFALTNAILKSLQESK